MLRSASLPSALLREPVSLAEVGDFFLARAFIQGIRGTTTGVADATAVMIDSAGQLGTVSSSRSVKQDIRDVGTVADRLLGLRPVAFRYRQHAARDPDTPLEFGLLAEEVAEVFPELVIYDASGRPETVKYHLLSSLLLSGMQQQHEELRMLRERVEAIEALPARRGRGSRPR